MKILTTLTLIVPEQYFPSQVTSSLLTAIWLEITISPRSRSQENRSYTIQNNTMIPSSGSNATPNKQCADTSNATRNNTLLGEASPTPRSCTMPAYGSSSSSLSNKRPPPQAIECFNAIQRHHTFFLQYTSGDTPTRFKTRQCFWAPDPTLLQKHLKCCNEQHAK